MNKLLLTLMVPFFVSLNSTAFAFTDAERIEKLALIKQIKSEGGTVYAILPTNVSEPFFETAAKGCADAAEELSIHCIYYGNPKKNVRHQVENILSLMEAGVDGIAISAIKKGGIHERLGDKLKKWGKPIVSFDSPLHPKISHAHIGTNNYQLGKALGIEVATLKPSGGAFCIQAERPNAPKHLQRIKGIMDGLTNNGKDSRKWKKLAGCPLHHQGDYRRATAQMVKVIDHYEAEVFISTGGGPQFLHTRHRKTMAPYKGIISSGQLVFASIDTNPVQLQHLREGLSTVNVGQRPYEMGKLALKVLKLISAGGKVHPNVIHTGLTYCRKKNVETCTNYEKPPKFVQGDHINSAKTQVLILKDQK